jgi:acyl-CoA dehydrogenase
VNKLGTMPLIVGADDDLLGRYLPQVASGEAMFSYALSEREAGSDAAAMKTRAVAGDGGWVLNGQKSWITNAGVSKYYTVMAVTDPAAGPNGISAFVVHADDPGFSLGTPERKLGIHGSPTREIFFEDCWIPADRIVGEPGTGFQTAMRTLDHTRVTIGAQALGIAQGALDASVAYAKDRKQFGKPIAAFQGMQFLLADMAMKVETARALTYTAAAKSERHDPDLTLFAAAAKCYASDIAMQVTTDAVQVFGGAGYVRDNPVERYMRDAKITQIYEGTNQIQRMVIGRQLLK